MQWWFSNFSISSRQLTSISGFWPINTHPTISENHKINKTIIKSWKSGINGFQSQVDNLERDSHLSPPWSNLKKLSKIPNQKSTFRDHGSVGIYCLFRGYDFNQITPNYTWFFQKKNQLILSFWEIADYLCVRECIFFARNQVFAIMVPLFGLILLHF